MKKRIGFLERFKISSSRTKSKDYDRIDTHLSVESSTDDNMEADKQNHYGIVSLHKSFFDRPEVNKLRGNMYDGGTLIITYIKLLTFMKFSHYMDCELPMDERPVVFEINYDDIAESKRSIEKLLDILQYEGIVNVSNVRQSKLIYFDRKAINNMGYENF